MKPLFIARAFLPKIHAFATRVVAGLLLLASGDSLRASEAPLLGWETLARPDRLAEFKPPIEVGCVSSHDRTGGNDDGFSGKYSFLRREADGLVIADLEGPGVIYRLWTPTPTDDWMEFYFDGEAEPRIRARFRDLFLGETAPFVKPFVGYGVGGFFSYLPLPYARSCKVVVRAERIQFYQINYARYAPGSAIQTFSANPDPALAASMARAAEVLAASGRDLTRFTTPPGSQMEAHRQRVSLAPGRSAVLFEATQAGRIVGLRLTPADALTGKARDLLLRISFDGDAPSVLCPVGDFFGYAWGDPAMRSLFVGSNGREAYCHFPMPFDRSAKIELVSERSAGDPVDVEAEVALVAVPRRSNEGRFGAVWRRENPTQIGQPFTFFDFQGRGQVVGFVVQAQGFESGKTLYFEGDDTTWIDGRLAVQGTGSEDFFNGGWYDVPDRWEKPLNFALSGCLGYQKHLARTGGYRLLLGDAYSFGSSLKQTIEHSGAGNDIPTDHVGVTYFYAEQPSIATVTPAAQRAVTDLRELVFPAGWQISIRAFPFLNTTLTKRAAKVGGEDVSYLSLRGGAPDWVGPAYLYVTCHVPTEGRYEIEIEALRGPEQGMVQLFQDEVPVGEPVDLFAETPARSGRVKLGVREMIAGDNPVMLKLVGKNERAQGLGLDLIQIVCRRLE
ncbi:MAG: glycoside hydrolase family 172 protein [Limisphaerales bacterium]